MFNYQVNDLERKLKINFRSGRELQCKRECMGKRRSTAESVRVTETRRVSECEWQLKMGRIRSTTTVFLCVCLWERERDTSWSTVSCVLETSNPSSEKEEKEKAHTTQNTKPPDPLGQREYSAGLSGGVVVVVAASYTSLQGEWERGRGSQGSHNNNNNNSTHLCVMCVSLCLLGVVCHCSHVVVLQLVVTNSTTQISLVDAQNSDPVWALFSFHSLFTVEFSYTSTSITLWTKPLNKPFFFSSHFPLSLPPSAQNKNKTTSFTHAPLHLQAWWCHD